MEELTNEEKLDIAEFIFSESTDVLIKSDAEKVIVIFENRDLEPPHLEVGSINDALAKHISQEDRDEMMEDYYAGRL